MYGKNASRLTHTLNSSTHEYKIQGLSSLTTYTIDVAALTSAGAGLATSSTISSGVPPGQCAWGFLFVQKPLRALRGLRERVHQWAERDSGPGVSAPSRSQHWGPSLRARRGR